MVKSDEYYGHDPRLIETGVPSSLDPNRYQQRDPVRYKGRLQFVLHGGKRYLLLPKNYRIGGEMLSQMVSINNSGMEVLGVTEEGFEKVAETKKQRGYIAAYQVVESASKDETRAYIATVQENALSGKTISTIFIYKWHN